MGKCWESFILVVIMATIKYRIKSKKSPASIYVRVSNGRNANFEIGTGLVVNPSQWSEKKGMPKAILAEGKKLKLKLESLQLFISNYLNEARQNNKPINAAWGRKIVEGFFANTDPNKSALTIIEATQELIANADTIRNAKGSTGLSVNRIKSYKGLIKTLHEYNADWTLGAASPKEASLFLRWLLDVKQYGKGNAYKKIADLKAVCNWSNKNGIQVHSDYSLIEKGRVNTQNIIYLTPEEVDLLKQQHMSKPYLENARKWLLIGCEIGQRGGDLRKINKDNIKVRNGLKVIELVQRKTGNPVTIPVSPFLKQIIKEGLPHKISMQKLSGYIKEVCKEVGIDTPTKGSLTNPKTMRKVEGIYPKWRLVSTQTCRKTYATNNYGQLPTSLIKYITGHSTEKMLLVYIGKKPLDFAQQIADYQILQAQKAKKTSALKAVK